MRHSLLYILAFIPLFFCSCVDEEERPDTPSGNFEALWQIIDEHYCFFDYKQHEYGLEGQGGQDGPTDRRRWVCGQVGCTCRWLPELGGVR